MLLVKEAADLAIENDAKGQLPANLLELPPDCQNIEILIWLLWRKDPPNLDEERIKEVLARMAEADPVGDVNWRRIIAAFDHAGGRHGTRVKKLRQQYLKIHYGRRKIDPSGSGQVSSAQHCESRERRCQD